MSHLEELPPPEFPEEEPVEDIEAAPSSLLAELRERREQFVEKHTYDVDVPGFGGRLALRLVPLSSQDIAKVRKRWESSRAPDKDVSLNSDFIITACQEVRARRKDEPWKRVEHDGVPVRIDAGLAQALGFPPVQSARQVLLHLFSFAPSPAIAIGRAANDYMEWASEASEEIDGDFVGES